LQLFENKLSIKFLGISLLLFAFYTSPVYSENDWIGKSIDLTINSRFDEAEDLVKSRLASGDSSIEVYFYYASVLNSKMTHFEKEVGQERFLICLKSVIDSCNEGLKSDLSQSRLARYYFFRGSASAYLAFFQGRQGSWYPAFKNGLKAREDLEKAIEYNPELHDAYLGIGTFQYWVSTRLKWLPFVSDSREEGIENIVKAVKYSDHSRYLAMHQLIYILLDFKKYDEALVYAKRVIEAYPESPFMGWAYAHTLYKMKKNEQALQAYKALLRLIEQCPAKNPMHWVACHVKMAEIYKRLADTDSCRNECELVLSRSYSEEELTKPGKEKLEQARELLKACE